MKYRIKGTNTVFENIEDVLDYCIDDDYHDDDNYFEDWVNETYSDYKVSLMGYEINLYSIAENCSNGLYNELLDSFKCEMNDYDREEANNELNNADPDDEIEIQAYTVQVIQEEEEEEEEENPETSLDIEDAILRCRKMIEKNLSDQKIEMEKEKQAEDDLMNVFI